MPNNNWPIFLSSLMALIIMMMLNHYLNWALIPDLLLLVLLQSCLQERVGVIWRFVLPISLLLDLSAQTLLGFHGAVYALLVIMITPLASFWSRASLLEQSILVILISVGTVVLRTLALFIITDVPAPAGWYLPIITQIVCWPLVCLVREMLYFKFLPKK